MKRTNDERRTTNDASGYETVIGLEVHLQLATDTKAFCSCSTRFGSRPNSQTCPVCLGFPGALPVLNEKAFHLALKVALGLDCAIQETIKFDRKNYYYPDLPKNFQISQYDMPLAYNGHVEIFWEGSRKRIRIRRVHLEEDAGKLIHETAGPYSLVDYNRSGIPLLEIVTEPDIGSPQEAYDYLVALKGILQYLKVSDCDMEKGSLRCDANISLKGRAEKKLGSKVELKNMNSFKNVRDALEYEVSRQADILAGGGAVVQETRLWNADRRLTEPMRYKEEETDYRYFPEPDLVPFVTDARAIDEMRNSLPELPEARRSRLMTEYGLSGYDAAVLTSDLGTADYFEECLGIYKNAKTLANWITGDMAALANVKGTGIRELGLSARALAGLLRLVDEGAISGKMAKEVLSESIETGRDPGDIVASRGLAQISDAAELEAVVKAVISANAKSAADYRGGKKNALAFLIGQVMKATAGKANPAIVNEVLKKHLEG